MHTENVVRFQGAARPDAQDTFPDEYAAELTEREGRLFAWAARFGTENARRALAPLSGNVQALVRRHGPEVAAVRMGLPVGFVRGMADELDLIGGMQVACA